ncbi:hypothetical protein C8F01DRAFT_271414 [Mycena amicta]|nr:hypothetical protein C8F01DRAFT_271414 [Mycena amicta]
MDDQPRDAIRGASHGRLSLTPNTTEPKDDVASPQAYAHHGYPQVPAATMGQVPPSLSPNSHRNANVDDTQILDPHNPSHSLRPPFAPGNDLLHLNDSFVNPSFAPPFPGHAATALPRPAGGLPGTLYVPFGTLDDASGRGRSYPQRGFQPYPSYTSRHSYMDASVRPSYMSPIDDTSGGNSRRHPPSSHLPFLHDTARDASPSNAGGMYPYTPPYAPPPGVDFSTIPPIDDALSSTETRMINAPTFEISLEYAPQARGPNRTAPSRRIAHAGYTQDAPHNTAGPSGGPGFIHGGGPPVFTYSGDPSFTRLVSHAAPSFATRVVSTFNGQAVNATPAIGPPPSVHPAPVECRNHGDCPNCGRPDDGSGQWRWGAVSKKMLCTACGQYENRNGRLRPLKLEKSSRKRRGHRGP